MPRLILLICLLLLAPAIGAAQIENQHRGQEYIFFAPGGISSERTATLHLGGGGLSLIYKGLGVGWELGYLTAARSLKNGFGILSANGFYHFPRAGGSAKLIPFGTGGYSLAFRSRTANGFNFGGGVNYWFDDKMGLRLEFRDHRVSHEHFYGFRIGFTFGG